MDKAKVTIGSFIIAGCKASGIFEFVEAPFDHVAQGIDSGIDGYLYLAVPLGRDHCHSATLLHIFTDKISIIALISEQHLGRRPISIHHR